LRPANDPEHNTLSGIDLAELELLFPVWFEAKAAGKTPMCEALATQSCHDVWAAHPIHLPDFAS
jgi:hypothetical protein